MIYMKCCQNVYTVPTGNMVNGLIIAMTVNKELKKGRKNKNEFWRSYYKREKRKKDSA